MFKSALYLLLGLTATIAVLTPMTVEAATFDYTRLNNITARPIDSNDVLKFDGEQSQNEGYVAFSNADPNAPDSGHIGLGGALSRGNTAYYIAGRQDSPDPSGATRAAGLENITGFSNFFKYLKSNNIPLSSIGFSFGSKSGQDLTKTWNLGEDKFGQDWFVNSDSTIGESIYRANPNDVELSLTYGTSKIISFGYSDTYFVSVNDQGDNYVDNLNIFLLDPVPAFKVASLDPLASGLADAFLQDVNAGGGSVQLVSEDVLETSDVSYTVSNGFEILNLSFSGELRVVKSKTVPDPSSALGLLVFGVLSVVPRIIQQKS
ncbi:PEP-CTERM sorting domain-containing protein [Scytonema sp. UIC 10036]|uniref:PEP-CTERM sorting domain-containing protein n=1 Tax=Scytonema sp. UIC 10036 TaxID=2304196 RepID=UPI0012DAE8C5|nr:PEP-CTERM sorting domain-containing protein [Scytonema sp. UIC 10036]MUH01248.1 PEP-CTERM sorting domain-containing protein [Scytonema sp. UIC 10036]